MIIDVKNARLAVDGQVILDDVSLTVDKGACHVLLGENGSGKTTLLDCIRGARRLTSGDIRVLGEDAAALPWPSRGRLNSVLAPSAFPFNLRVKEICRLYCSIYCVSRYPMQQLAELFSLTDIMDKKWSVLSSGQKQKALVGPIPAGESRADPAR
jgi:ABC-type multidrug transport system, ATPase component